MIAATLRRMSTRLRGHRVCQVSMCGRKRFAMGVCLRHFKEI